MAYIVDLIIIMQIIFVISEARPDGVVKLEEVEDILNRFEANQCNDVQQEISNLFGKWVYSRLLEARMWFSKRL